MNTPISSSNTSNRRTFLKRAGIGAGLAALYPYLSSAPLMANHHKAGKSLGIALVGLGGYAMGQLAPAFKHTKNCHLAGLVTGTPDKAEKYGKEYHIADSNIYNYDDFDDIAKNDAIDVVYIALPNSMHAEYTIRAAKAGKHVICEKPMALTAAEGQTMMDACKANGVELYIGYRLHYDPYHVEIRKLAADKPYGSVSYVESEFSFFIGDPTQWRLRQALAGGGAIMDVGPYCIQAARYATGEEPFAITAQEFKTDKVKFAEVDETVTFQMEFPGGAISNSTNSYNQNANRLHVAYKENYSIAQIEPAYNYSGQRGHINRKPMSYEIASQQAIQMDSQCDSIMHGTPSTSTGEEGMRDMVIIDALYKSLRTGKRVVI